MPPDPSQYTTAMIGFDTDSLFHVLGLPSRPLGASSDAPPGDTPPIFKGFTCCHKCGKTSTTGSKLRMCKGCSTARYCDAACQKAHWPEHKPLCRSRNDPAPSGGLNMTKYQEFSVLQLWAKASQRWALERVARATIHLAPGGVERFLRERWAVVFRVELNVPLLVERAKTEELELAGFFRVTRTGLRRLDSASASWHEAGAAADPRYAGVMPVVYESADVGSLVIFHRLRRFRDEGPPDDATRAALGEFQLMCMAFVNMGRRLDPLEPDDPVAYPFYGERGTEEERPAFTRWGTEPGPGKTGMGAEALMRAYAALEWNEEPQA